MLGVLQWFIGLGSTVFLPIVIILYFIVPKKFKNFILFLSSIFFYFCGEPIYTFLMIGEIGLGLVIDLLSSNLGTAIQKMGEKYGTSLSIMDIGCGVGGPLAFSTTLGISIIVVSLVLNLLFVVLGWTKTLNVDIWNFWYPAFLALVANAVTGSVVVGVLAMVVALMLQWLLADLFQEKISSFFGYPGIAITHMMALSGVIFAIPVNWLFDHIPGLNKIDGDAESIGDSAAGRCQTGRTG